MAETPSWDMANRDQKHGLVRKIERKSAKLLMTTFTFRFPSYFFYDKQLLSSSIRLTIVVSHGSKVRRKTLILHIFYILFDHYSVRTYSIFLCMCNVVM